MKALFKSKLFIGLVFLLAMLILLPPLFPIQKYKGQIEESINRSIKGKVKFGTLNLAFYGTFRVGFDQLEMTDREGRVVASLKSGYLGLPWIGLLSLAPRVIITAKSPEISVLKLKDGTYNAFDLVPSQSANGAAVKAPETKSTEANEASASSGLVAWVASRASVGFDIEQAGIRYEDIVTKSVQSIQDLSLKSDRLSISKASKLEVNGRLKARDGSAYQLEGPFSTQFLSEPVWVDGEFKQAKIEFEFDGDDLNITVPGSFEKKAGTKLRTEARALLGPEEFRVTEGKFEFLDFAFVYKALGNLKDYSLQRLEGEVHMAATEISGLSKSVKSLALYDLKGFAKVDASWSWAEASTEYSGDFSIEKGQLKGGALPKPLDFSTHAKFKTDALEAFEFSGTSDRSDFKISGDVKNFAAPKFNFDFASKLLDLDALMPPSAETAVNLYRKDTNRMPAREKASRAIAKEESPNIDLLLAELAKNPLVAASQGVFRAKIQQIKSAGIPLTDFVFESTLERLVARVTKMSGKILGGSLSAFGQVTMTKTVPQFSFQFGMDGVSLKDATESQLPLFKKTISGILSMKVSGQGSTLNSDKMAQRMDAQGSFKVLQAKLKSIDVAHMLQEAMGKATEKLGSVYPKVKNKTVRVRDDLESEYASIASSFKMVQGRVSLPDFEAKAEPNGGVDMRGQMELNLVNRDIRADWTLIDTYNMTKLKDVSVEIQGVEIPEVLAERGKPVEFPISLACKIEKPCPSYLKLPEHFGKIALKNVSGSAKKAVVEKVKEAAKGAAKEDLKEAGKKLFKGLFK